MPDYDGKITIGTEVDLSGFKAGLNNLKSGAKTAGASIDGLGNSFGGASGAGKGFEDALGGVIGKVTLAGAAISAAKKAGELFVDFMVDCTKASIKFESAITGVYKTVDATNGQLAEITVGIKELAMEIPATTTEIAGVAEAAGQLGIATDDILGFTEVMINLGEATNLTAEEAASSLAKFANITKMSADNYERLGSTIVGLGNNFATTEADIVNMATRLASTAEVAGFTEAEMLALSAALSSVGMEAEAGGTAIAKLIKEMQDAAHSGKTARQTLGKTGYTLRELELLADADSKAFKELAQSMGFTSTEFKNMLSQAKNLEKFAEVAGMTANSFAKMWDEAPVEAMNAFISGLGKVNAEGGDALTILNELGFTEVRLSNAVLSLATSEGVLLEALTRANEEWEKNNALSEETEKRYDTLGSKINMFSNAWERLQVAIGDTNSKIFSPFVELGTDIIDWVARIYEKYNFIEIAKKIEEGIGLREIGEKTIELQKNFEWGVRDWLANLAGPKVENWTTETLGKEVLLLEIEEKEEYKNREPTKREHEVRTTANAYQKYLEMLETTGGEIKKTPLDKINELLYEGEKELSQILADIGMDAEDYHKMLESFTNETTNAFGRTDTGADNVLGIGQMIANLEANQKVMREWGENMDTLAEKMMNFEGGEYVMQQFRDMGISGAAQVARLVTATDEQLKQLAEKMQEGIDLSLEVGVNVIGGNAETELEKAMKPIKEKLAEYKELFEHGMLTQEQFDNLTKPLLDQLGANIGEQIEERKNELKEQLEAYNKAFSEGMLTQEQFDQLTKPIYKELDELTNNMDIIEKTMRSEVESALIEAQKEAEKADTVGKAMTDAIAAGIAANKLQVRDAIVQAVEDGVAAAKEAAGIVNGSNSVARGSAARGTSSQQEMIDGAKEHAYTPTASAYSYTYGGNSNQSNSNVYNGYQVVNFNQPIASPGEAARRFKETQKEMAKSFSI